VVLAPVQPDAEEEERHYFLRGPHSIWEGSRMDEEYVRQRSLLKDLVDLQARSSARCRQLSGRVERTIAMLKQ